MKRLHFSTAINANREKVWESLWDDANYRNWTSAFCEGSYAVSDWKEGSKVLFLSPDGGGMVSRVETNKPFEFMSFEHLGEVKNGVEDTYSDEVKKWAGAFENYTLEEVDGTTQVTVELDVTEDHADFFEGVWPKALEKLKTLAEGSATT